MDASRTLARQAANAFDEFAANGDAPSVADIAARLGVSDRHLRRIFFAEHGVTPLQYLQTRRLLLAKQLLTDTQIPVAQIALSSGFRSLRRFNAAFVDGYRMKPDSAAACAAAQRRACRVAGSDCRRRRGRRQRRCDHGHTRLPTAARFARPARLHRPACRPGHRERRQ
jgi:AraC-like DNA-binding protein